MSHPTGHPSGEQAQIRLGKVFVSHAQNDRQLADNLQDLIKKTFSGVLGVYLSSNTGGTGVPPGNQWLDNIHGELSAAEAVWVLATPESVKRPWIFWEAGRASVTCRRGVVVVCVGMKPEEVPSPLNVYQAYNGQDRESLSGMLRHAGQQIGMEIPEEFVLVSVDAWLSQAKDYRAESGGDSVKVEPEQVGELNEIRAKLDLLLDLVGQRAFSQFARADQDPAPRVPMRHLRGFDGLRPLHSSPSAPAHVCRSLDDLVRFIDLAPPEIHFLPMGFQGPQSLLFRDAAGQLFVAKGNWTRKMRPSDFQTARGMDFARAVAKMLPQITAP